MAPSDDAEPRSGTPVPPRGGKGGANRRARPGQGKPARPATGTRPAPGSRPGAGSRPAANRTASNRRTAVARQRQHRQTLLALAAIGVVVVVVAVFIIIKVSGGSSTRSAAAKAGSSSTNIAVPTSVYDQYTATSVATLDAAATHYTASELTYPTETNDPALTKSGKPEVLFIGAEYCPYCATERWALIMALSKFGTFSGLTEIHSSSTDVYPDTPTWSFYKSTYTSKYLTFTPVEEETVTEKPLQSPTAAESKIATKYDSGGSIPFVYFNGKAIISGAEYNPELLHGKTFDQVVTSVSGGTSKLADNVDADAGAIVSEICRMTGGQPGSVCTSFPKPITS